MPSLRLHSAYIGGFVSPLFSLLAALTAFFQRSVVLVSLIPSLTAARIVKYRAAPSATIWMTSTNTASAANFVNATSSGSKFMVGTSPGCWSRDRTAGESLIPLPVSVTVNREQHCNVLDVRSPAPQESAPRSVTAPRAVKVQGGTRKRSKNRLEWLQIALHLEDTRLRK